MSSVPRAIFDQVKKLIPPLDGSLHKGQSGRVGVLGGAMDYTGAPYFAAISALRLGADLSHVICSPTAAGAIKTYAPDLIVHPMLEENSTPDAIKPALQSLLSRLHVLIIGPGLGREPYMQSYAALALQLARERGMFVVLDADGLYLVGQDSDLNPKFSLIKGYRRAVLTPNVVEFSRLCHQLSVDPTTPGEDRARDVSWRLGGVTVLEKGREDTVAVDSTRSDADGEHGAEASLEKSGLGGAHKEWEKAKEKVIVDVQGGMKRVGGQGDVLSGSVGAFLAWGKCYEDGVFGKNEIPVSRIPLLAAVGASMVTRTTSRLAYQSAGRSMITADMLPLIGKAFQEMFDEHPVSGAEGQTKGKM